MINLLKMCGMRGESVFKLSHVSFGKHEGDNFTQTIRLYVYSLSKTMFFPLDHNLHLTLDPILDGWRGKFLYTAQKLSGVGS